MRAVIAEDALFFREGLASVLVRLGHEVVGMAEHGGQVLGLIARHRPDIAILDMKMPLTFTDEGLRLTNEVRRRYPSISALVLSQYTEPAFAARLLDGERSVGYLLKQSVTNATILEATMNRLRAGEVVVDEIIAHELVRPRRPRSELASLTERELEVLALIAQGYADSGIGRMLFISVSTVNSHNKSIFRKLGLTSIPGSNTRVSATLRYLAETTPV